MEEHRVPREESERAFNYSVGMVAVLAPEVADAAVTALGERGVPAWPAGEVRTGGAGESAARLVGTYR